MGVSSNKIKKIENERNIIEELKEKIKNELKEEIKNELNIKENQMLKINKPIPLNLVDKVKRSICKITVEENEIIIHHGTGFFYEN